MRDFVPVPTSRRNFLAAGDKSPAAYLGEVEKSRGLVFAIADIPRRFFPEKF